MPGPGPSRLLSSDNVPGVRLAVYAPDTEQGYYLVLEPQNSFFEATTEFATTKT